MADQTQDRVLTIERYFDTPPSQLFQAWVDPARHRLWMGPKGVQVVEQKLDPRPGGVFDVMMENAEGQRHHVRGEYKEVVSGKRLVFTFAWVHDGERGHETVVKVDFQAEGDGTKLRLTQELFETEESRDHHNEGWSGSLDRLEELTVGAQAAAS
ncbi:MAG: SRPBCC domain-containing protein [Geminicoccaceae bacterium]